MNDPQDQEDSKVYHHTNRTHKYPNISKNGTFKYSQTKTIQNIIFQCEAHYPTDIQNQADLIVKSLQQQFSKHFQIFIYLIVADEGHCLTSVNARHVVIDYKEYSYLIWQVYLDQNFQ